MSAHRHRSAPARRSVLLGLAAVAAGALTGCGLDVGSIRLDGDGLAPTPTPGPDELARRQAVLDARALQQSAAAAAAVATRPGLAELLTAVAGAHAEHLRALGDDGAAGPASAATGAGATARSAVPGSDPAADLVATESAAAGHALAGVPGTSGGMARLLASVAAADAVHARRIAAALGQPEPPLPAPLAAPSTATTTSSGGGSQRVDDEAAAALTAALDGEHAAVYGYGVAAARLNDAQREAARVALAEHSLGVRTLEQLLAGADRPVPPSAPAYEVPGPVTSEQEAVALAALLEERTAALHADLVAAGQGQVRAVAADLLVIRALRTASWRGAGVPLPGLSDP